MNLELLPGDKQDVLNQLALGPGAFDLYYQPQVSACDGRLLGAEALLRFERTDGVTLGPDHFVHEAEASGAIVSLGIWALLRACAQARKWRDQAPDFKISVNLSPRQLEEPGLFDEIQRALALSGLPSQALDLEITESLMMNDYTLGRETLARAKTLGVSVSLDDFGSGFSSLGVLHHLPIDRIKLDRCFVRGLPSDKRALAVARAVTAMGKELSLTLLAEGIERQAQADCLLAMGWQEMQGYLFGRPVAAPEFECRFLSPHSAWT